MCFVVVAQRGERDTPVSLWFHTQHTSGMASPPDPWGEEEDAVEVSMGGNVSGENWARSQMAPAAQSKGRGEGSQPTAQRSWWDDHWDGGWESNASRREQWHGGGDGDGKGKPDRECDRVRHGKISVWADHGGDE